MAIDGPTTVPASGVVGMPATTKGRPRADFKEHFFESLIEQKGYRLAWSRAANCPCVNTNSQTLQPDPNCALCRGKGWLYFAPTEPVVTATAGELDSVQQLILTQENAGLIRGIMTQFQAETDPYTEVGNWQRGDVQCTVRYQNKLGYYDRLINLDSEIVYAEVLESGKDRRGVAVSAAAPLDTRYLVNRVNLVRSVDAVFQLGLDYELAAGRIAWRPGRAPAQGTRLSLHYLTHPVWLVVQHPHAIRTTAKLLKKAAPITPQGDPTPLPIQAHVRLEFVPG